MAFSGGAAAVVGQVMSVINAQASASNTQVSAAVSRAITTASQRVSLTKPAGLVLPVVTPMAPLPQLPEMDGGEAALITETLRAKFAQLIDTYFPSAQTYADQAGAWLTKAITVGGTGISSVVEEQLWARERNRTLKESARATDEATSAWAAKGYAMPPGALLHQVAMIDLATQEKLGESSREQTVKSFEAELDNVRLAVGRALELRSQAVSAAVSYIGVLIGASTIEVQKQRAAQEAYSTLVNAVVESYRASLSGADLTLRAGIAQQQADIEVAKTDANLIAQNIGNAVQAAVAAVQAYAQMAGSALNGLHAQAAISGSDQTSTSESTITNL